MVRPSVQASSASTAHSSNAPMVTARNRDVLYLPGGKVDAGESAADAAARETREEVAVELVPHSVRELFTVVTQAHGEPDGRQVRMVVFAAETDGEPQPSAEVSAVHWVTTADLHRCPPAGSEVLRRLAGMGLID